MAVLNETGSMSPLQVWEGVSVRVVHGDRISMAIAELAPNIVVPEHRHHNEQLGVVVQGSARFIVDGESRELVAGGTYRFLSNVAHQVEAGPDGAVLIESFTPVRSDWNDLPQVTDPSVQWPAAS